VIDFLSLRKPGGRPNHFLLALAFVTFTYLSLQYLSPALVTPDLLAASLLWIVYRLGWCLSSDSSWGQYSALGLALACCYYAKTALFVLACVFLALLAAGAGVKPINRQKLAVTTAVFLVISAPLVIAVSRKTNHVTIGEAGPLNYLWYANLNLSADEVWEGRPMLKHGPHVFTDSPMTTEFSGPVPGTYPIWYDPAYWWQGAKPRFELSGQLRAMQRTFRTYIAMLPLLWPWLGGLVVLYAFGRRRSARMWMLHAWQWPLLWPIAALARIFGLVHVEERYIAPFSRSAMALRLSRTAEGCGTDRQKARTRRGSCTTIVPAVKHVQHWSLAWSMAHIHPATRTRVHNTGARTEVAWTGPRRPPGGRGEARYGRMRVAAQILDAPGFWSLSASERDRVAQRLSAAGVRAIIIRGQSRNLTDQQWHEIHTAYNDIFTLRVLPVAPDTPAPHRSEPR
jgi:hypothetical protein